MRVTSLIAVAVPVMNLVTPGKVMKRVIILLKILAGDVNSVFSFLSAWVQDSGDNWSPSSSSEPESDGDATDVIYEVEYEIETDSSSDDLDDEESGSSDIEVRIPSLFILKYLYCNMNSVYLGCSYSNNCCSVRGRMFN